MEVGWEMKHEGLQRIAKHLNIGTDSLVFLDDNPAEIELIRQVLPEVECVLVPADAALRPACLNRVHSLDRGRDHCRGPAEDSAVPGQCRP